MTVRPTPPASVEEIRAEAQLADQLIKKATKRVDFSDSNIRECLHLEFCRAEQRAYLEGLLCTLGYPTMLDRLEFLSDLELCDAEPREPHVRNSKA